MRSTPDPTIDYDDVDDIIATAERLREKARNELTLDEMREVGAEVGIPAEYIDRAHQKLQEVRRAETIAAIRQKNRRRRLLSIAGGILLVIVVAGAVSYRTTTSRLSELYAEVERHQAEVANVKARQQAVEAHYRDLPDSIDKQAELIGAENRVHVATQRFHEAAARYNSAVRLPPASLITGGNLPKTVKLSHGTARTD
ncbi:hypothetical protein EA187_03800 [Lujinxingia sediminis]|uniref:LemA family protein n=1 Tax=Lujinxingia sediminis TaxID=2480984 RepID=A0ABY0CXX5_9DELT|nr:hypothetical protein [Lujinxingia sediminis]RVU48564.1 hypothetical protein EA187_03800 [Lujinxingia sediminis]